MTLKFARHQRLLICLLALLAPLPLPFNEPRPIGVVGFPYLSAYLITVAVLGVRLLRDRETRLSHGWMNVLGLLYLPYLALDVTVLWTGSLVRPMMHLAMFGLAVKLWAMRSERDKWQTLVGVFFVFLTAMATSTHPAIVVYLLAFAPLALLTLTRLLYFHLKGLHEAPGKLILGPRSIKRYVAAAMLLIVALSVPLFLALPRFRNPYFLGTGQGDNANSFGTGFNEQVTLDVIGNVRSSREVAMRLQLGSEDDDALDYRFKGATFDRYQGLTWTQSPQVDTLRPQRNRRFRLADGEPRQSMHIWLLPIRARSLFLPTETLSVEVDAPALQYGIGGAIALFGPPRETLEYDLVLGSEPRLLGASPERQLERDLSLDLMGVTPEIRRLAEEVAGDGDASERARRIERHLITQYEYTLDFLGRSAEDPIGDFLFRYKSGHCEYFASSMVLMLRSIGIPARFVTGFLGTEYNPIEGYYIVRQSNAHAWVEAWLPEGGWTTFDPTPPAGRPVSAQPSLRLLARQSYDWILFRWDRYIISFGAYDQSRLFAALRDRVEAVVASVRALLDGAPVAPRAKDLRSRIGPLTIGLGLLVLLASALVVLLRRWRGRRPPATAAFDSLKREASRRGVELDSSVPPVVAFDRVRCRFPEVEREASMLLDFYLRESFRGDELDEEERRETRKALLQASRTLRDSSRRLRKAS